MIIFGILIFSFFFNSLAIAATQNERLEKTEVVHVSYPISNFSSAKFLLNINELDDKLLPGSYNIKAKFNFKSKISPIKLNNIILASNEESFSNPLSSKKILNNPLPSIPLNVNSKNRPLNYKFPNLDIPFSNLDQLNLDYFDHSSKKSSEIQLEMVVSGENLKRAKVFVKGNYNPLILKNSEYLVTSPWNKKNLGYLIKRTIDSAPNQAWQYKYKNKYLFFQKRFTFDLSKIEAIDFVFKKGVDYKLIRKLNCNLRVGYALRIKPTKIIECKKFPQKFMHFENGMGFRLFIADYIRSEFTNDVKIYLDELIFFIPSSLSPNFTDQPLNSVNFQELTIPRKSIRSNLSESKENHKETEPTFYFYNQIETSSSGMMHLKLSLDKISEIIGSNGIIHSINLSSHSNNSTRQQLHKLKIINFILGDLPITQDIGNQLSVRWGGLFLKPNEQEHKIESVHVKSFIPFYDIPQYFSSRYLTINSEYLGLKTYYNSPTKSFKYYGLKFKTDGYFYKRDSEINGLDLEGKGNWIEFELPFNSTLDNGTRFFLDLYQGWHNILDIQVFPFIQGIEQPPFSPLINKSYKTINSSHKIEKFRIRINLVGGFYQILLKEIAIFNPILIEPSKVFDNSLPLETEIPLIPYNIQSTPRKNIKHSQGRISTYLFGDTRQIKKLAWETTIEKKLSQIRGLKLSYKIPPILQISNPCWLQITLISNKQNVSDKVCPDRTADQLIIPLNSFFTNLDIQSNDTVKAIKWEITTKNNIPPDKNSWPIEIGVSIFNYEIDTLRNHIAKTPIIFWNDHILSPEFIKEFKFEGNLKEALWMNIGVLKKDFRKNNFPILGLWDHPYLEVESINLEKTKSISLDEYNNLIQINSESTTIGNTHYISIYRIILFFFLIIVLFEGTKHSQILLNTEWKLSFFNKSYISYFKFLYFSAIILYLIGWIFSLINWRIGADIFLSFASIVVVLIFHKYIFRSRHKIENICPNLTPLIFKSSGTPYLFGFLTSLAISNLFLLVLLNPIAEHIAIIGYYLLIIGLILESKALLKKFHLIR